MVSKASLEKWIDVQDAPRKVAVSSRAALRVIPFLFEDYSEENDHSFILPALRQVLVAVNFGYRFGEVEILKAIVTAHTSVNTAKSPGARSAVHAASSATETIIKDTRGPRYAVSAGFAVDRATLSHVSEDRFEITRGTSPKELVSQRQLFLSDHTAVQFQKTTFPAFFGFGGNGDHWASWREWYQGFLYGKPLDWELQRRVALIPDEDWEKGPAHIAELIEENRKRFELEKRIEELEEARAQAVRTEARLGIGGNNPPEPIEEEVPVAQSATIIWAAIDELKEEIAADTPDKSRIARIIETLSKGLLAILKWCAKKGDLGVDTLIKWSIPAAGVALLTQPEKLQAVIEAAKDWVSAL